MSSINCSHTARFTLSRTFISFVACWFHATFSGLLCIAIDVPVAIINTTGFWKHLIAGDWQELQLQCMFYPIITPRNKPAAQPTQGGMKVDKLWNEIQSLGNTTGFAFPHDFFLAQIQNWLLPFSKHCSNISAPARSQLGVLIPVTRVPLGHPPCSAFSAHAHRLHAHNSLCHLQSRVRISLQKRPWTFTASLKKD